MVVFTVRYVVAFAVIEIESSQVHWLKPVDCILTGLFIKSVLTSIRALLLKTHSVRLF